VSWIRRLFSRQKGLDEVTEEVARGSAGPDGGAALADGRAASRGAWAAALGIPQEALEDTAFQTIPAEAAVAEAVLVHFDAHRPGLTSFPSVALKLLELVRDPRVDAASLARTIELDTALSTGMLVLANSAVFRGVRKVETLREAVARLGVEEVAHLATALSTRSLYRAARAEFDLFGPTWNQLFYHGATVAKTASALGRSRGQCDPERLFLGGLLHDVGKSLALRSLAALQLEGRIPSQEGTAVDRILHQVHVVIGAAAHRDWGLPAGLSAIAEWHHLPEIEAGPELEELHLVRLVSALELIRTVPGLSPAAPAEAVNSALALGIGPARVEELRASLSAQAEEVRRLFGEDSGGPAAVR
jgi:putative nucleotidyltransferase with HDIG domain